ncbi:MAG: glutamate-5-semialdehyde dehydrogenase [Bacteriovoracaceae bacterium]
MNIIETAQQVKQASSQVAVVSEDIREKILHSLANNLKNQCQRIITENEKDISEAKKNGLKDSLIDRLLLNEKRIDDLIKSVLNIANQPQVVGNIVEEFKHAKGMTIQKQRIPIGVIGMIFESRPNVVVDCAALAIKSGNAMILKGGKEAYFSNKVLGEIVSESLKGYLPSEVVVVLDSTNRKDLDTLLTLNQYIDIIIPRGGESLIKYIMEHSKIPVIAHLKGLCHIYVDQDANLENALKIILNAKVQRPGVCNAVESILIHEKLIDSFLPKLVDELIKNGVELRVSEEIFKQFKDLSSQIKLARIVDYQTEYLDKIVSMKLVKDEDAAIKHIQSFSSHHTECILSQNDSVIKKFIASIDSSCIMVNASTRFNDGGELGLGAELGISTTKLHAYGPMGAKEMTTLRHLVIGNGQIR